MPVLESSSGAESTKEWKVRRFLAKPPRRAERLVLLVAAEAGDAMALAEYEVDAARPELAPAIVQALEDHATEVGHAVEARLVFCDAEGKPVTQLAMRREGPPITNSAELTDAVMKGDARSLVAIASTQSLALQKLYMSGMKDALDSAMRLGERHEEQVERLVRKQVELEKELADLRDALLAAEMLVASPPAEAAVSETQERALKLLESMAPVLIQKLLSPPPSAN